MKPNIIPFPLHLTAEAHVKRDALDKANRLPNGANNPEWEESYLYYISVYVERYIKAGVQVEL